MQRNLRLLHANLQSARLHGAGQGQAQRRHRSLGRRHRNAAATARGGDAQKTPMRSGGQYVAKTFPMIQDAGTGPQKRLSSESPRLSPIMKYSPLGIVIVCGMLHSGAPPQGSM